MGKSFKQSNLFPLILILLMLMGNCVPRKKMMYLQEKYEGVTSNSFYFDDQEYQLQPQDIIAVNIFSFTPGQFDFLEAASVNTGDIPANHFLIDRNGLVELPGIGDIEIAGLTIKETQNKIRNLLEDYLQSPLVRITLQTPFSFTILGEVNGPGRFNLVGRKKVNVMEAIALAGDLTEFADREEIRLVRREAGEMKMYDINVLDKNLLGDPLYQLKSEDILIVDPLAARSIRENQLFVLTTLLGTIGGLGWLLWNFL